MTSMKDRIVLVTGGTGGIGLSIATGLAGLGAMVIIVGRDEGRGRAAVAEITAQTGTQTAKLLLADLSSRREIERLAQEVRTRYGRLNVLINNAGALHGKRSETVDGIEATLAINHLCPFLLTHLLLPLLLANAPSRVINVNSEGHRAAKTVDFTQLDADRWKRGFQVYSQTKLANLLFTYELARRLNPAEVTVNALHPGIVDTQLFRRFVSERLFRPGGTLSKLSALVLSKVAQRLYRFDSAQTAAQCPIYLASSSEVSGVSGKYFNSDLKLTETSPASYDRELSQRVWDASARLVGLTD